MRNKLILLFCCVVTIAGCIQPPTHAAIDYEFTSGTDTLARFGRYTSYDGLVPLNSADENLRRNKDAAALPLPYGIFSGEIPTDASSLYHENNRNVGNTGYSWDGGSSSSVGSGTNFPASYPSGASVAEIPDGLLPTTSIFNEAEYNLQPWYNEDGSIGSLYIPKLGKTISVYEGESLESMSKGIGHFTGTSVWDGLVGLAGHNRGAAPYFAFVKDLSIGDTLVYSTPYGTRTYKVFAKKKIGETDYSGLAWTVENTLSLITCIENEPAYRWLVQAKEVVPQ